MNTRASGRVVFRLSTPQLRAAVEDAVERWGRPGVTMQATRQGDPSTVIAYFCESLSSAISLREIVLAQDGAADQILPRTGRPVDPLLDSRSA